VVPIAQLSIFTSSTEQSATTVTPSMLKEAVGLLHVCIASHKTKTAQSFNAGQPNFVLVMVIWVNKVTGS